MVVNKMGRVYLEPLKEQTRYLETWLQKLFEDILKEEYKPVKRSQPFEYPIIMFNLSSKDDFDIIKEDYYKELERLKNIRQILEEDVLKQHLKKGHKSFLKTITKDKI